jgi:hypothetical protein
MMDPMPRTPRALPFFAALSLVMLLAAGCAEIVKPQYRFAEVRVRVTDDRGEGVGATPVTLYTGAYEMGKGLTNPAGEIVFTEVAAGGYGVAIHPNPYLYEFGPGERNYVDTLHIAQGERREVTWVLRYTGP